MPKSSYQRFCKTVPLMGAVEGAATREPNARFGRFACNGAAAEVEAALCLAAERPGDTVRLRACSLLSAGSAVRTLRAVLGPVMPQIRELKGCCTIATESSPSYAVQRSRLNRYK